MRTFEPPKTTGSHPGYSIEIRIYHYLLHNISYQIRSSSIGRITVNYFSLHQPHPFPEHSLTAGYSTLSPRLALALFIISLHPLIF